MATFLDITAGEKCDQNEGNPIFDQDEVKLNSPNHTQNKGMVDALKRAFNANLSQDENEENIFAKNSHLNIFINNVIDDKQDIIDNLSKVINEKLSGIDTRLYKVDEIIEKFAKCKQENEQLKSRVNNLRDENCLLKHELGKFSKVFLGIFLRK